jgi:hypothetical protein
MLIALALTPPVASCLVIVHATKEARSMVPAISAVAATWTLSNAFLPPIRSVAFAFGDSSSWGIGFVAVLCVSLLALTLLTPQWIFSVRPWIDKATEIDQWLTFFTRAAAMLLLAICLLSTEIVLGRVISELASSGLIIYLVIPEQVQTLPPDLLSRAASDAISSFFQAPGKIVADASRIPGLAFSIMIQIAAMTLTLASAMYRALAQGQGPEKKVDQVRRSDD